MKKAEFYSAVHIAGEDKTGKLLRNGYTIKTESNNFGIFKNEFGDFDIIDLETGLSINFLRFYKLKDFRNNIRAFDEKLIEFKTKNKDFYNQLIEKFTNYDILKEE